MWIKIIKKLEYNPKTAVVKMFMCQYLNIIIVDLCNLNAPALNLDYVGANTKEGVVSALDNANTYFFDAICKLGIPNNTNWMIHIIPHNDNLLNQIREVSKEYGNWKLRFDTTQGLSNVGTGGSSDYHSKIGTIFAQEIKIPGVNTNIESAGCAADMNNGFARSPVIGASDFQNILEIGFLETNSSFIDGFLRPYSKLTQRRGLLARDRRTASIKCDIILYMIGTNKKNNSNYVRKEFMFSDCAPYFVTETNLNQKNQEEGLIQRVNFVYNTYSVIG